MGRPAPDHLLERIVGEAASPGEAAGPAQVVVDGIEVTQAVQDHLNSVPLVAGKRTVVRVYLSYAAGPASVRGVLRVGRAPSGPWYGIAPIGPAELDPSRSGSSLAALLSRRHELGHSLNFVLPASLATGTIAIRLGSARTAAGYLPLAPRPDTTVTFAPAAPLRVHIAKIRYTEAGSTATHSGGPWSPRFQELFDRAGMSLDDAANRVQVSGHKAQVKGRVVATVFCNPL